VLGCCDKTEMTKTIKIKICFIKKTET
jgi:hypothetical protein